MRSQLVALDCDVDLSKRGAYLSPSDWEEKLNEKSENTIILDVRNRYESIVGHFEGAIQPDLENFRDFPSFAKSLYEKWEGKDVHVLIYCTGGIRCELYSPILKQVGFKSVYQLEGGVVAYGLSQGSSHWRGKLFVFDDRMVVPISSDCVQPISECQFCKTASDTYYNCANMDCNELFLACTSCAKSNRGCCQSSCLSAERLRKVDFTLPPKPFRKLPKLVS